MAQLVVEVKEKGIRKVDTDLQKLGKTGANTEKSLDKTDKSSQNLSKSMVGLGKTTAGVTTAMAAAGAAVAATTIAISAQVVATDNLRRVSGLSIDQFEASAFAAQQYGLTVDQLGGAFKDTSERIGEFIATGGGPLQDFADVIGLTAEQTLEFAKEVEGLSGKDVLVRMVNELESAGASAEEMSFALEGMASDLTLILPLLTNNASEFNRLSQAMDAVTLPLDQEDIDLFRGLNESVGLATGAFESLLTEAVIPLVEPLTELSEAVAFLIASLNEGTEAQLSKDLVDLVERSRELERAIIDNESAWGRLTNVATFESTDSSFLQKELDEVNAKIEETREKLTQTRFGASGLIDTSKPLEINVTPVVSKQETVGSTGESEILNATQIATDAQVEIIRQGLLTEQELRLENTLNQAELISQSTLAEEEQAEILGKLWDSYYKDVAEESAKSQDERAKNAKKAADEEAKQNQRAIDGWDSLTQDLKSTLGEQNAIFKASASINATIKAYEAANSAYAALAPIPIIGPGLGAAAAGVAIGAGLANVAAINSARQQGGQVNAGDTVLTGERGRELFVPETNGSIISANMLNNSGGGGGTNVYITNNSSNSTITKETDDQGDIYVRIDDLDSLVGTALGNPNSESYQGLNSVANLQRS